MCAAGHVRAKVLGEGSAGRFSYSNHHLDFEDLAVGCHAIRRQRLPGRLPTAELEGLVHIGTLDASHKKGWSFEGACLSVSQWPDEWEGIAQLGGSPWWQCSRPGHRFVDALALAEEDRQAVEEWGVAGGLCEREAAWEVSWYDEELEEEMRSVFLSRDAALQEARDEEHGKPRKVKVLAPTEALRKRMGTSVDAGCFDEVLICFAEDHGYDGVFWDEILDPQRLSAPRAGIVPSKVKEWRFERMPGFPRMR